MLGCEIVSKFIADIEPEELPVEYLQAATITDSHGQTFTLKGDDLAKFMNHDPKYSDIENARIYIDMKKIMQTINLEVEYIYHSVEQRMLAEEKLSK